MPNRNPFFDWFGLDLIDARLSTLEGKLDQVLLNQQTGKDMLMAEREEMQNLIQRVQENRDTMAAATDALTGLVQRVADQQQELQDAIANSSDVSPEIKAVADELAANTEKLRAAIPQLAQAVVEGTEPQGVA